MISTCKALNAQITDNAGFGQYDFPFPFSWSSLLIEAVISHFLRFSWL